MKLKQLFAAVALFVTGLSLQGCAVVLVGAAAAGATGGAVSYFGNELETIQEVTIDKAWTAAQGAVNELQYTTDPTRSRKDGVSALLYCRNGKQQKVIIQLFRQSDRLTEIHVRIGFFDTTANRQEAQLVYEKMRLRF